MKVVSVASAKMVLEHVTRDGDSINVEVLVDNDSKRFIKQNVSSISYDVSNKNLKIQKEGLSTTVARAFCQTVNANLPADKKIQFKDGNKFNLRTKNLMISE